MKEHMTRSGATKLAKRIEKFWRDRGHSNVKALVEVMPGVENTEPLFCVRSNLVDGWPPQ